MKVTADVPAVNLIPVRMGEMAVSDDHRDVFSVVGLGSCVATILVAPQKRVVGLAHVVLPESRMTGGREAPAGKFADTAVPAMLTAFGALGAAPGDTYAVLVGGATMFGANGRSKLAGVGERNIDAVRAQLAEHGIGTASEEVGGEAGRSVHVAVADLDVYVRSGQSEAVRLQGSNIPLRVKISDAVDDHPMRREPGSSWIDNQLQTP
jgi:chemotaxis protein CheD